MGRLTSAAHRRLARFGRKRSPQERIREASEYWVGMEHAEARVNAHWPDAGSFDADGRFREIGQRNLRFFEMLGGPVRDLGTVLEWGCGGGANVAAFGPESDEYIGVDVSAATLSRAAATAVEHGVERFTPLRIPVDRPESVLTDRSDPVDVFVCTYVFELLPSRDYGRRVLTLAARLLRPGGRAFMQFKYHPGPIGGDHRRGVYARRLSNNATFTLEEFWSACEQLGLTPRSVILRPTDELVDDVRSAFLVAIKPDEPG